MFAEQKEAACKAIDAEEEKSIPRSINELEKDLNYLAESLKILHERLYPICASSIQKDESNSEIPINCEMEGKIVQLNRYCRESIKIVRVILDDLQI